MGPSHSNIWWLTSLISRILSSVLFPYSLPYLLFQSSLFLVFRNTCTSLSASSSHPMTRETGREIQEQRLYSSELRKILGNSFALWLSKTATQWHSKSGWFDKVKGTRIDKNKLVSIYKLGFFLCNNFHYKNILQFVLQSHNYC